METLQTDERLIAQLFDHQPDAVVWFVPVFDAADTDCLVDLRIRYCNAAACIILGAAKAAVVGSPVATTPLLDDQSRKLILEQCKQVWKSGDAVEFTYHSPHFDKFFNVQRSKVADGILSITRDRTELVRAQVERERHSDLFKKMMDDAPYGISIYDSIRNEQNEIKDFRLRACNQKAADIVAFTMEQLRTHTVKELIAMRGQNADYFHVCKRVVETGEPVYIEHHSPPLKRWFGFSMVKFEDGYLLNYIDITPHKEAALEVERQKVMLDNILTHSASGITVSEVVRDATGAVVDWRTVVANDAAARFTGFPKEAMLTQSIKQLDPALYDSDATKTALRTLETGEPFVTTVHIGSTNRWLEVSVSRMDADRYINVFTDVTPLREAQRRLEQSLAELKHSNVNLELFASMASHDLQEPLRKINVFAGQVRHKLGATLEGSTLDKFLRIEQSAKRMQALIDDLLAYSQVSRSSAVFENVDLNEALRDVLADLETTVLEKSANVVIGELPVVKGNPSQLRHLFQNLLSNALKYSKPGEPPAVSVTARQVVDEKPDKPIANSSWHIDVKDNGIGFPQADAERIFVMFQRLHGKSEFAGTGVGLAIARKAVENHGGTVTARSVEGEGTTFTVTLPA